MTKQAIIPLYIRFGELPKKNISKVHFSDEVIREEGGLSVFKAVEANNKYYPVLPEDANESGIADYFNLLFGDRNVYLVTGEEMRLEGADREPLLIPQTVVVIKKLDKYYRRENSIPVLDQIKAEIEEHVKINQNLNVDRANALCWCIDVIDKYK